MNTKLFAFSWIAGAAIALISSPRPAYATLAAEHSDGEQPSYALISNDYETETGVIDCGDNSTYPYNFKQRMTLEGGHSTFVFVEFVYPPGRRDLYLQYTCNGYDVYGAGSCACSTTAQDDGETCPLVSPRR